MNLVEDKYVPKVCLTEGNSFSYVPFWCSFKTYYVTDRNEWDSDTTLLQSARISDPSIKQNLIVRKMGFQFELD